MNMSNNDLNLELLTLLTGWIVLKRVYFSIVGLVAMVILVFGLAFAVYGYTGLISGLISTAFGGYFIGWAVIRKTFYDARLRTVRYVSREIEAGKTIESIIKTITPADAALLLSGLAFIRERWDER
jgi:hypothetical protein